MVNEKNYSLIEQELDADRINRLKSTLKGRLNLLNIFEPLADKNYKPLTLENIDIDITSEYQITNFMLKNNDRIEYLELYLSDFFNKNGSRWQKSRLKNN
jgi:hypothetical protein